MDRKEVACPAIVHNAAFSIVIKEISVFCIKGNSNVSKAFSKSRKSRSRGIFFNSSVIDIAVN